MNDETKRKLTEYKMWLLATGGRANPNWRGVLDGFDAALRIIKEYEKDTTVPDQRRDDEERCGICRFCWLGRCRRHAPAFVPGDEHVLLHLWPQVHSHDGWCGDFERRKS